MTHTPTIVVGVDGSAESRRALRWACDEAGLRGHDIVAASVWNVFPVTVEPLAGLGPWEVRDEPESVTRETLHDAVTDVSVDFPNVRITEKVVAGHPAEQLSELAGTATMLVVGARGHGGLLGMLLGSTSRHVLAHCPCTVVVVR